MKKVSLFVAAALLMSTVTFAKQTPEKKQEPVKTEKKEEKKEAKKGEKKGEKKAEKKAETKTPKSK